LIHSRGLSENDDSDGVYTDAGELEIREEVYMISTVGERGLMGCGENLVLILGAHEYAQSPSVILCDLGWRWY
jgi:hypothetical protein